MTRRDYSPQETNRMFKHLARFERAAKKASPERLAAFERHMSARSKLRSGKQVSWALMNKASEHAMNKLGGGDWKKFDNARRTKKTRESVKRKLGLKR